MVELWVRVGSRDSTGRRENRMKREFPIFTKKAKEPWSGG